MSLKRFTVLTVLCIAMTPSTQALESSKQSKARFEISTFHDEEERFQFVIVRSWQPNIEKVWVCDAGLDLNRVFEELRLHRQRENTSSLLELFCNKTLPGLNKLESTETSNDTDYNIIAEIANALDIGHKYNELIKKFSMYISKEIRENIISAAVLLSFLLVMTIVYKLYDLFGYKLSNLFTRKAYKTPKIPLSMTYTKKHGSEECLLIDQEVLLDPNNLNTNETHNDITSIGVIKSSKDHYDIQTNQAAIIRKLHSPHQDIINTNLSGIEASHEASTSRKPYLSDQNDIHTNPTGIKASHVASTSRKPHSSDQNEIHTNPTGIEANNGASTSRKPHSSDHDGIYINPTGIKANYKASTCGKPHLSDQNDIYTNPTGIKANHEASTSRKPHSSDQNVINTNQIIIGTNHEAPINQKPQSVEQDDIYTNPTCVDTIHETSISRKPHPPYQVSTNQIGGLEKEVDVNRRTSCISFDQASCNLSNETKLTSTSQASLTSNMVDNRRSTCSSDISFCTVSVCDYDLSSLSVSSDDSGCQDDPIEPDEESSSELDARFNREYL